MPRGPRATRNLDSEVSATDNYATHKHPKVRTWLANHPRWTFHFTPTSASWLNAVEGFFAKLTRRRLKRGVFRPVLVAWGILADGNKALLHLAPGTKEDSASCREFFQDMRRRELNSAD